MEPDLTVLASLRKAVEAMPDEEAPNGAQGDVADVTPAAESADAPSAPGADAPQEES